MPFRLHKRGVTVAVRLTPGARRDSVAGVADAGDGTKALKAAVRTPPEDGRANKALIELLAGEWGVPKSSLSLLSGDTSRKKTVLVEGDGEKLLPRLRVWLAALE